MLRRSQHVGGEVGVAADFEVGLFGEAGEDVVGPPRTDSRPPRTLRNSAG